MANSVSPIQMVRSTSLDTFQLLFLVHSALP
jgi:hypothetical protein